MSACVRVCGGGGGRAEGTEDGRGGITNTTGKKIHRGDGLHREVGAVSRVLWRCLRW